MPHWYAPAPAAIIFKIAFETIPDIMTYRIGHMTYSIGQMNMLGPLFGSKIREKVLIFIFARERGYAREIARFFDTDINQVQKQLDNLELGGILISQTAGRTRLYEFNPRYPVRNELLAILDKTLTFYPDKIREQLIMNRRRPRRKNKPL